MRDASWFKNPDITKSKYARRRLRPVRIPLDTDGLVWNASDVSQGLRCRRLLAHCCSPGPTAAALHPEEADLMPRLMAVSLTEPQVREKTKTVTRRAGWLMLRPGDQLTLCRRVMVRRRGEPLDRIAAVIVVTVRRERLDAITAADVAAEGFPNWTPAESISFFCRTHHGCKPGTEITRIKWCYLN
jgi:hypothetical protein